MLGIDLSATAAHGLVRHTGGLAQPVVELLQRAAAGNLADVVSLSAANVPCARPGAERPGRCLARAGCRRGGRVSARASAGAWQKLPQSAGWNPSWKPSMRATVPGCWGCRWTRPVPLLCSLNRAPPRPSTSRLFPAGASRFTGWPLRRCSPRANDWATGSPPRRTADEALAEELEEFARRQARVGAWQDASTALFSASRLSLDIRSRNDRLLRAVDALVGAGNIAQAQMWTAAVDALPPSPLRSSVLGYLSTASGQNDSAQTPVGNGLAHQQPAA